MPKDTKVKKKAKKRLPKGFLDIPCNPDKKTHESWTPGRDIGNIPRPHRGIFCSDPSRGKTFQCQQLIARARPYYDYLFVVHPYAAGTSEWDNMDLTEYLEEIPPPEFWDDYTDGRICLVLEDFEIKNKYDKNALSALFRWCSSHIGRTGITVYLLYQELFRIPVLARRCADFFVLWDCVDKMSQGIIEKKVGLEKGELEKLFGLCKDKRDSICIDRTPGTPYPLRFNLFTPIKRAAVNDGITDVEEEPEIKEEE